MQLPTIHYDHLLGAHPEWRSLIVDALSGKDATFTRTLREMALFGEGAGARVLYAMLEYAKNSQQVFCLGPKMQRLFAETSIDGVPRQFFRLPYPCFYVALPDGAWSIWGGAVTGMHRVAGVYVQQVEADAEDGVRDGVRIIIWGRENEKSVIVGDDATFWFTLDLNECPKEDREGIECLNLDTYLDRMLADASRDASDPGMAATRLGDVWAEQKESSKAVLRAIASLILYLNSEGTETESDNGHLGRRAYLKKALAGLKNPKKRRHAQRELDSLPEAHVVWIGRAIEREADPTPNPDAPAEGTGRTQRKHLRRGHFHHFWVGQRKDASGQRVKGQRLIQHWVQPFWAGSGKADLLKEKGRVYRLDEERADG